MANKGSSDNHERARRRVIEKVHRGAWILACLTLLIAGRTDAAITLVQSRSITYSHTSTGVIQTLAFTNPTVAGNFVLASCGEFDNRGDAVPVFKDALGNHFTNVTFSDDAFSFAHSVGGYANIVGGAMTVGCFVNNATFYTIIIAEYSGVDTRFPIDVFNQAYSTTGSSKSAGPITTTQAHEAIAAFYYDDHIPGGVNFTATIGSGFTIREQASTFGSNTQGGFADKIVTTVQVGLDPAWSDATWATDGVTLIVVSMHEAFSSAPGVSIAQKAAGTSNGTTDSMAFGSPNTNHNLILAGCAGAQAAPPTLTIGDTQGNAYTSIDTLSNVANTRVSWWYAKNVAAGSNTVTCTSSLGSTAFNLVLVEYHGLDSVSPLDQHAALHLALAGTITTPAQPASITITSANEIVILFDFVGVNTTDYVNDNPANYVERLFASGGVTSVNTASIYDQYVTSTGTFQPASYSGGQSEYYQLNVSFIQGATPAIVPRKSTIL